MTARHRAHTTTSRPIPTFFILGAARCGTASLFDTLRQHPDICVSAVKEPPFFQFEYERGMGYYRATYFSDYREQPAVGEAAHRNLYLPYVADRIFREAPDAKLIVMVRNPVERAFSHYWYQFNRGKEPLGFEEAIEHDLERISAGVSFATEEEYRHYLRSLGNPEGEHCIRTYVDSGYFARQIERYSQRFGTEQIKIVKLERYKNDEQAVLTEILSFLGVAPDVALGPPRTRNPSRSRKAQAALDFLLTRVPFRKHVPHRIKAMVIPAVERIDRLSGGRSVPSPPAAVVRFLSAHFEPHNRELEKLTGMDFSDWNATS